MYAESSKVLEDLASTYAYVAKVKAKEVLIQ
jgi:hypothetical protein